MRMQALGLRLRPVPQAGTLYRIHPGQNSNLTAAMEEGMSVARIRVLLALGDRTGSFRRWRPPSRRSHSGWPAGCIGVNQPPSPRSPSWQVRRLPAR